MKTLTIIAALVTLVIILLSGCVDTDKATWDIDDAVDPENKTIRKNVRICEEVAKQYHETHTYVKNDVFDCDNMACDVWNMLKTKGVNAKIVVGNVDLDKYNMEDWNHAWVIAEIAPDKWLAIECTEGYIVYEKDNPRYYRGHFFNNPKSLRDFNQLYTTYQTQLNEYDAAINFYNALVDEYNDVDYYTRAYLKSGLQVAKLEMEQKERDLDTTKAKLDAVLEYG